ncbi:MAG: glycosyltransferase family 4 protein, partial [Bryobacteraceae bacterium]
MTKIRVCIDATPLLLRSAGVKTYVYYWAKTLRRIAGENAIPLFPFIDELGECVHERSILDPLPTHARLVLLHLANYSPFPLLNPIATGIDIFHASHQLLQPPRNVRRTATLYDMTCWLVPEMHSPANVAKAKEFAERVMRGASGLIAISESTRDDAVRILNFDPDRITVIYPGVAEAFFHARPAPPPKPYVLFVGTIEPRKNVVTLLDAYAQLPASLREEFDLVVAGSVGWGDAQVLQRLQTGSPGVRYLGYVPEEDLPALTAAATVFVYPSLYEGFGLPLAQAMAARVPAITSNVSSLPEVACGGALLVDPQSVYELKDAMERLLLSPSLQQQLVIAGSKRAQLYRWENCARGSLRFFERV